MFYSHLKTIFSLSNLTKRQVRYSFESASAQIFHPKRTLSRGTDRLLLTPNLLVLADHGNSGLHKHSANLDDTFSNKLLAIIDNFYNNQPHRYVSNLGLLVQTAVQSTRSYGCCTLTVASMHPKTGDVYFYYIGDSLYGIFRRDRVEMVEGLYEREFNRAKMLGFQEESHSSAGYIEEYPKSQIDSDDLIVVASNGLWNNVPLDVLHYQLRGPGSYRPNGSQEFPDQKTSIKRSLNEMAERVSKIGEICSKKGNYDSPIYLRAQAQGVKFPRDGFLDDVSVILARRNKELVLKDNSQAGNEPTEGKEKPSEVA